VDAVGAEVKGIGPQASLLVLLLIFRGDEAADAAEQMSRSCEL
jgi:hypothetical protein